MPPKKSTPGTRNRQKTGLYDHAYPAATRQALAAAQTANLQAEIDNLRAALRLLTGRIHAQPDMPFQDLNISLRCLAATTEALVHAVGQQAKLRTEEPDAAKAWGEAKQLNFFYILPEQKK